MVTSVFYGLGLSLIAFTDVFFYTVIFSRGLLDWVWKHLFPSFCNSCLMGSR